MGNEALLDPESMLTLVFDGSYKPNEGDEFLLISAQGGVFGEFGRLNVIGLGESLGVELRYLPDAVFATVTPTPASAAVLAMGGVFAARRRRR